MQLDSLLSLQNPWWRLNFNLQDLPEFKLKKRFAFESLEKAFFGASLMLFLKGMRRLGKSTLMKQLTISLLQQNPSSAKDVYFMEFSESFSDLNALLSSVAHKKKVYLFLDEIQYCQNWRDLLKTFYDQSPHVKIVFSGSSNMAFSKEKESLMGRFLPVTLRPLTFNEYLFLKFGDYKNSTLRNESEWNEYIHFGEFPELLTISDPDLKHLYFRESILNPLLSTDISFYNVLKKAEFADVLKTLASGVAQVMRRQNIASEIGISRPLLNRYLSILEDIGLICLLPNYYRSVRQQISSDKKVFFTSTNLVLSILGIKSLPDFAFPDFKGHVFENAAFNELRGKSDEMFYWKRKNHELDFLGTSSGGFHAYEIKQSDKINIREKLVYEAYAKELQVVSFTMVNGWKKLVDHVSLKE